jgi:LuxR family maltose regulon positive regulatory protein
MCASLWAALDDRTDARAAQELLDRLDSANLFLIPLDGERHWYRYHHLFADLLRARLHWDGASRFTDLHRRASGWLEHAGLLEEAIHHALHAEDFTRSASSMACTASNAT